MGRRPRLTLAGCTIHEYCGNCIIPKRYVNLRKSINREDSNRHISALCRTRDTSSGRLPTTNRRWGGMKSVVFDVPKQFRLLRKSPRSILGSLALERLVDGRGHCS